jgi:hypothetical protein
MARIPLAQLRDGLVRIRTAGDNNAKGRALEDFICFLFPLIPGIEIAERNALNAFRTEEVDVALWNERHLRGLSFLPTILLVECKNWSSPCGSQEVSYFINRLRQRGCDHGIFVATKGITGIPEELTRAHFEVASALASGIRVLVITPPEVETFTTTDDIVKLFKRKLCQLVASGTTFL